MTSNTEMFEAKRKLYSLILKKSIDTLTNNEIEIGYLLAQDKDIQDHLNKCFDKKKGWLV